MDVLARYTCLSVCTAIPVVSEGEFKFFCVRFLSALFFLSIMWPFTRDHSRLDQLLLAKRVGGVDIEENQGGYGASFPVFLRVRHFVFPDSEEGLVVRYRVQYHFDRGIVRYDGLRDRDRENVLRAADDRNYNRLEGFVLLRIAGRKCKELVSEPEIHAAAACHKDLIAMQDQPPRDTHGNVLSFPTAKPWRRPL